MILPFVFILISCFLSFQASYVEFMAEAQSTASRGIGHELRNSVPLFVLGNFFFHQVAR